MALLEDLAENPTPAGLAVGLGAALIAPFLLPAVSRGLRPAAKAALSSGIMLYRRAAEPLGAMINELVTEAQVELATSRAGASTPARDAAPARGKGHKAAARGKGEQSGE